MELRQIEHFLSVVEAGSLTGAATRLGLSQQALSKSIARLEASVGGRLFTRTARGVAPTRIGELLLPHARAMLAEAGQFRRDAEALVGLGHRRLVVGLGPVAAAGLGSRAIAAVQAAFPALRMTVEAGLGDHFVDALTAGRLDLAVAAATAPVDAGILATRLYDERWVVVGRAGHPLLDRAAGLRDLHGARWLMGRLAGPLRQRIEETFRDAGLPAPDVPIETTSLLFGLAALETSDLLSILPLSLVARNPRLRILSPAEAAWTTPVVVLRRRRAVVPQSEQTLLAALERAAADLEP